MNERYANWNRALIQEYFPLGNRGRLSYLPVDDDELRALADDYGLCSPDDAVAEFVAAVRAVLAAHYGSFTAFTTGLRTYRRTRPDEPPYVAGLAFCVLAGSRMEADVSSGIAPTNYYVQLNRLLGRDDRAGMPSGFDRLIAAWEDLSGWLDETCAGERGLSTVRTYPHRRYIGYPLSQCLLRACDRRRLPDFFSGAGLEPGTEISEERLFALLRAWAVLSSCGLSQCAQRAIAMADDIDRHEIAETVARELEAWDGELRDPRGRRRGPLHLWLIPRGRRGTTARLIARRLEDFPAGSWRVEGTACEVRLDEHLVPGWYQPLDLPVGGAVLERGFRLTRDGYALSYEPADAFSLREAPPELGGWLSQPQASLWEPQLVVVRRSLAERAKRYLAQHGDTPEPLPAGPGLPAEWALFGSVRFTSVPAEAPPLFSRLAPRIVTTTSLDGGLPVSRGIYLTGGEPDVHIAVDQDGSATVELDGHEQSIQAGALTLRLADMELKPGEHTIDAGVRRTFTSIWSFGDTVPHGAGALGHQLTHHRSYHPRATLAELLPGDGPPRGTVFLTGALALGEPADLPLADRPPLLARAGGHRYYVLGARAGEIEKLNRQPPAWLSQVGLGQYFQFIEVDVSFDPVWLLVEDSGGSKLLRCLRSPVPGPVVACDDEAAQTWAARVVAWADAQVEDPSHVDVWREYFRAAAPLRTRMTSP